MPLKANLKYPGLQKQAYILTNNRHCFRKFVILVTAGPPSKDWPPQKYQCNGVFQPEKSGHDYFCDSLIRQIYQILVCCLLPLPSQTQEDYFIFPKDYFSGVINVNHTQNNQGWMFLIDQIQLIDHQWWYKFKLVRKLSMHYDTTRTRFIYCNTLKQIFL